MTIGLRSALDADNDLLLEIFESSRPDFALLPLPPQAKRQLIEQQRRAQLLHYAVAFPGAQYLVVEAEGAPVGQLILWQDDSQLRVVDIAVLPPHRGRGIGTLLMTQLQARAREAGLSLQLAVWGSNQSAVRFYRRLGFEQTSDDAGYLQLGWEANSAAYGADYQRREVG